MNIQKCNNMASSVALITNLSGVTEESSEDDHLYNYFGHVKHGQVFGKCSQLSYS